MKSSVFWALCSNCTVAEGDVAVGLEKPTLKGDNKTYELMTPQPRGWAIARCNIHCKEQTVVF